MTELAVAGAESISINGTEYELKDGTINYRVTTSRGHFEGVQGGRGFAGGKKKRPSGLIEGSLILGADQRSDDIPDRAIIEVPMEKGTVLVGADMMLTSEAKVSDGTEVSFTWEGKSVVEE